MNTILNEQKALRQELKQANEKLIELLAIDEFSPHIPFDIEDQIENQMAEIEEIEFEMEIRTEMILAI